MVKTEALYYPSIKTIQASHLKQFIQKINHKYQIELDNYEQLDSWSIQENEKFWDSIWDYCNVVGEKGSIIKMNNPELTEVKFFPYARLNYAQNLLNKVKDDEITVIFKTENKFIRSLHGKELKNQVSKIQQFLIQKGIQPLDRVAGIVSNTPEALIAMLATTSLGAIWTSCSPDFGKEAILERFSQTKPKLLFGTQSYLYNLKSIDCTEKIKQVAKELPSILNLVLTDINAGSIIHPLQKNIFCFLEIIENYTAKRVEYTQVDFSSPLFIMYSSGTTGIPKCIVHSVGGTLIEHLKEHQLHCNIKQFDRVFYFTTCGWMMWNWQVSALASGASLVLFDGSPMVDNQNILIDYIDEAKITLFGTAAKFIETLMKKNTNPKNTHSLRSLKTICSTGSPLSPECFEYVYNYIKSDILLASISGGTDIIGCFLLGCPILPVYSGEIQARSLGLQVCVFDEQAQQLIAEKGDLVCLNAFPSMPIYFWNDKNKIKYKQTYFSDFKNVWKHGDFIKLTKNKGYIIYGRSDTILNPGGVRIGTAEIYRQVNSFELIEDSIIIGQNYQNDVRVILFVVLKFGVKLNEDLIKEIKIKIKQNCSPRHVPSIIIQVSDVPKTRNGKITELAVKSIIENRKVKNINALANPESLEYFKNLTELV